MNQKKKISRKVISYVLALAMVIGLLPGMGLTAHAESTEELLTTITATGKEQASYSTAGVATVSFSYTAKGSSNYYNKGTTNWGWWGYGWIATVTPADGYTITKCIFYDDANRTATDSSSPFVVETTEEDKTPQVNGTPILAHQSKGITKIDVYGYATPSHSHNFTYTASGATITATCEDGCPDGYNTNGIAVTLSAPNNFSYDGNAKEAVISGYPETTPEGLALAPTGVTYFKSAGKDSTTPDGNALAGAPSDCGNYVAQMTWGEKTASVAFSIIPGTISASADDVTLDYDGTSHGISVNVTNPASGYTIKYGETSDGCTLDSSPAITNVKDSPKTVYYKVTAPNYNDITGSAKISINKADQTAPSAPTKESATGTSVTLAEVEGCEYKMNEGNWQESPTFTGLEAGTSYTFCQRLKGDDNHNPSDSSSGIDISTLGAISAKVTFKVVNGKWNEGEGDAATADKTVTLTGYEGDTLKLTADQIPTVGTKPNNTYKAGSWDVTPSTDTAITEATTYTYTYVAKEASLVTKAPEAKTLTYNGQAQELVTAGTATGGEMQYALGNATEATGHYTTSIPTETNAGTYYVWYKVIGDANHNDSEDDFVEAKINPVDKTDLNNAIKEAEAYYNTIKVNSDYSEQKEALGSAISTAKLLAGNDNVTAAEVSEGITAVNSAKATAETAVEGIIESNKEAFTAEKATQKNNADALAKDGDSDASRKLIEDAKKAIDAIDFDNTKTLDDNKAALADIITKLTDNLTTQRAADKLAADKAAFEVEKTTKQKAADALSEELDSDASKKLITDAKAAIEALTYDETKSLDENKAAIEAVITSLKTDLGTQRAEDLATNKEAFGADKETQKKAADALAADGDSDASKRLIEDAKKAIDEPAYDETKSLDENKAALAAIVSKLKEDLTTQRAADKKEADDTAAAKKVTDAINALPAKEDVTSSDKEAVEAARAAYNALTASQKDKIDTVTLKKLTDAEEALVALGELDKNVVAFNSEKNVQKAEAVKLAKEDDSDAVRKLIADAREAIDALAYDKNKSLDENKAAADAVKTKINALKAADKITTADKAAIEAARKAYDALSADQKKLVDAATLKKLTDTEKALTTAEANDKVAKELEAAKQEAQAAMNEQVTVTQKGNKFTVKWKKASSADGYYVYAQYCGKKATKPVKTIKKNSTTKTTITKIDGKKINQKKNFRVYVAPYKIVDGKKVTLGKSMTAHLVGSKNTKYSNVKKLTLTKSKYTVKVGKTAKIKAKVTLVNKNKKHIPKSHGAKFRYKSSDTSIANVDKNGKIKGIKKGTCTIYVYSINGLMKKAKVTVK